LTYY